MTGIIAWPDGVGVAVFDMHATGAARSTVGLDQRVQVVTVENRVWRGTVTLANMDDATGGAWLGFLAAVNGMGGVFDLPVPDPLVLSTNSVPACTRVMPCAVDTPPYVLLPVSFTTPGPTLSKPSRLSQTLATVPLILSSTGNAGTSAVASRV